EGGYYPKLIKDIIFKLQIKGAFGKILGYWKPKSAIFKKNLLNKYIDPITKRVNLPSGNYLANNIKEDVVIYADFVPAIKDKNIVKNISLKQEYQQMIKDFVKDNNLVNNSVGVHIRSTDKKPLKQLQYLFDKIR